MLLKQSYDVLLSSHASTVRLRRYMMGLMDNTLPERLADGRVVVHHRLARSGRFQKLPGPEPHNWVECRVDSRVRPDQTHVLWPRPRPRQYGHHTSHEPTQLGRFTKHSVVNPLCQILGHTRWRDTTATGTVSRAPSRSSIRPSQSRVWQILLTTSLNTIKLTFLDLDGIL
jgi:hypothetical protein